MACNTVGIFIYIYTAWYKLPQVLQVSHMYTQNLYVFNKYIDT